MKPRSGKRRNWAVANGADSLPSRWVPQRLCRAAHSLLCFGMLLAARVLHPRPHELEQGTERTFHTTNLTRAYWTYFAAGALIAAGFADFALIEFHFQDADAVPGDLIPVFYAVAMAS